MGRVLEKLWVPTGGSQSHLGDARRTLERKHDIIDTFLVYLQLWAGLGSIYIYIYIYICNGSASWGLDGSQGSQASFEKWEPLGRPGGALGATQGTLRAVPAGPWGGHEVVLRDVLGVSRGAPWEL